MNQFISQYAWTNFELQIDSIRLHGFLYYNWLAQINSHIQFKKHTNQFIKTRLYNQL